MWTSARNIISVSLFRARCNVDVALLARERVNTNGDLTHVTMKNWKNFVAWRGRVDERLTRPSCAISWRPPRKSRLKCWIFRRMHIHETRNSSVWISRKIDARTRLNKRHAGWTRSTPGGRGNFREPVWQTVADSADQIRVSPRSSNEDKNTCPVSRSTI